MGCPCSIIMTKALCKVVHVMTTLKETLCPCKLIIFIFQILRHVWGMVLYCGVMILKVWGGIDGWCEYLPHIDNSSLCGFKLHTIVPILNTKAFARWTEAVDTRLAWSRAEFELLIAGWRTLGRNSSSFVGARGRTVMWALPHKSNNIFKLQRKIIWIISSISNHTSCRQIF
jgi:hypothetical protein